MKFETKTITPDIAKAILNNNTYNRKLKNLIVEHYANIMLDGKWRGDTAEPIKIAMDNTLLDGQHRLHAVIRANIPVDFVIASGLSNEIFKVIDQGSTRNNGDIFTIDGVKNANNISAAISFFYLVSNYKLRGQQKKVKLRAEDALKIYHSDELFWNEVVSKGYVWYNSFSRVLGLSAISGYYAIFSKIDPIFGFKFMEELCTSNLTVSPVVALLKKRLIDEKLSIKKTQGNIIVALVIKTWNCFYENRVVKVLKFDPSVEDYPSISGLTKD